MGALSLRRSASSCNTGLVAGGLLGSSRASRELLGTGKQLAMTANPVDHAAVAWRRAGNSGSVGSTAAPLVYNGPPVDSVDALIDMRHRAKQSVVNAKATRRKGNQLMRINQALDAEMNGIFEKLVRQKALLKVRSIQPWEAGSTSASKA